MKLAKIKYVVMTNIPFDPEETIKWKAGVTIPSKYKAALRVDPILRYIQDFFLLEFIDVIVQICSQRKLGCCQECTRRGRVRNLD